MGEFEDCLRLSRIGHKRAILDALPNLQDKFGKGKDKEGGAYGKEEDVGAYAEQQQQHTGVAYAEQQQALAAV